MKKHITAAIVFAVLAGVWNTGCDEDNNDANVTVTMRTVSFDGSQGKCTHGGVKIEVLSNGVVDEAQSQYLCDVVHDKKDFTMRSTHFGSEASEGSCTQGEIRIEVITYLEVDTALTQYLCDGISISGKEDPMAATYLFELTEFDGEEGDCANGGIKLEILIDHKVQTEQTKYFCNSVAECATADVCHKLGESCTQSDQCLGGICYNGVCTGKGSIVTFGQYEQDDDTANGKEPITWLVLDVNQNHQGLLVSEKALDGKQYNPKQESNHLNPSTTWEESTIRSWLNGYNPAYNKAGNDYTSDNFIDTAFAAEEKDKLVASYVPAHPNSSYIVDSGNATTDKIFLLSIVEVENYFVDNAARKAEATAYAVKNGATLYGVCASTPCYSDWWLRSPGSTNDRAAYVDDSGFLNDRGVDPGDVVHFRGIRPALWVQY